MSSDLPSDAPSRAPESESGGDVAERLRVRGEPLLEALERHLPGAREHADSTATYAFAAAAELGLDRGRCERAREAVRLHEVGLVYVRPSVLAKPAGKRGRRERKEFDAHYEAGYRLARGAGIPEDACDWLLRMRESFDGSGPEGLAGEAIPIESRLMRATCTFHAAVAEPAPGSDAPPHVRGAARIKAQAGGELDPDVVQALVAVVERAAM